MTIDLDSYVDYIHYRSENVPQSYGDEVKNVFTKQYNQSLSKLGDTALEDQLNATRARLVAEGQNIEGVWNTYLELARGNLPQVLDNIANALNGWLTKAVSDNINLNYEALTQKANSYRNLFVTGRPEAARVEEFFNLLNRAMSLIQSNLDVETLQALTGLSHELGASPSYQFQQLNGQLLSISNQNVDVASTAIRYLTAAKDNLQKNGSLTADQFSGTIMNIFNGLIGEPVASAIAATGLASLINETDLDIQRALSTNLGNNVTLHINQNDVGIRPSGAARTTLTNRTAKVDFVTNNLFNLSLEQNGQTFTIEVGTNASVKWSSGRSRTLRILNRAHLVTQFPDGRISTAARNVIVHRSKFRDAWSAMRAGISASFVSEWLSGSGETLRMSGSPIDRAQFLFYNGKFYSILSIISRIVAASNPQRTRVSYINMRVDSIKNEYVGENDNFTEALQRSKEVNRAINNLEIQVLFNSNMLKSILNS